MVALLAEGVDRNRSRPSSYRSLFVALLAEGVDRNEQPSHRSEESLCRPPRGGRG